MRLAPLLLVVVALAGCATPAQPAPNTYAELLKSPIRGLSADEIASLENGSGAGLALPAELNGYPGPKHILEFRDELRLNESQLERIQALFDAMRGQAQAAGRRVLAAYQALDEWFRAGAEDEAALDGLVEEVGQAEAALRAIHLRAHLEALPVLTPHQRAMYQELRGYGTADHASHAH
ncbi:MAG: Spy/CpxP family protein refolding chaperone [Euryarchaeota archaeon]|nr:Spy/CpxP family protein refolding chaperone [Euryarchaeota archaeon]